MGDLVNDEFNEENGGSNPLDKLVKKMGKKGIFNKKEKMKFAQIMKEAFLDTPEFAKEILIYMKSLGDNNKEIQEKVIETHKDTIDQLFHRLDSTNLQEGEVDLIYDMIKDLSEKIERARRDYAELARNVLVGAVAIIGAALVAYNNENNNNYADDAKDDYLEEEYK